MLLLHEVIPQIRLLRSAAYHHIRHLEGSYIYNSFALYFCLLSCFSSLSSLFFLFLSASSSFFFLLISFLSHFTLLFLSFSFSSLSLSFSLFLFLFLSSSSLLPFPLFGSSGTRVCVCYNCSCYYLGLFPHRYVCCIDGGQNIHSVFIPVDFSILIDAAEAVLAVLFWVALGKQFPTPPAPAQDYVQGAMPQMTGDQGAVLLCAEEHERYCPPTPCHFPRLCSGGCNASGCLTG